jgi:NADH dehydrogenase FAD-containing subunit
MNHSRRHVVVAGAGVAGLETALALQALASEQVSVALIAPEDEFVYRPLSVAEPFHVGEMRRFPLAQLAGAWSTTTSSSSPSAPGRSPPSPGR